MTVKFACAFAALCAIVRSNIVFIRDRAPMVRGPY